MPPVIGAQFVQLDFMRDDAPEVIRAMIPRGVDVVLSDMAPNMTGVDTVDQARAMYLSELARDFADRHLKVGGAFLIKLFQGEGFDAYVKELRTRYDKLVIRKPAASRRRSNEVYALATGRRRGNDG